MLEQHFNRLLINVLFNSWFSLCADARYRKMFDMAINIIENKTCIRFKDREGEANFLVLDRDHAK